MLASMGTAEFNKQMTSKNQKKIKKMAKKMSKKSNNPMFEKLASNEKITSEMMKNKQLTEGLVKTISEVDNVEELQVQGSKAQTQLIQKIMSDESIVTGMMETSSSVLSEIIKDDDLSGWFETQIKDWTDTIAEGGESEGDGGGSTSTPGGLFDVKQLMSSINLCVFLVSDDAPRLKKLANKFAMGVTQKLMSDSPQDVTYMLEPRPHTQLCLDTADNIDACVIVCGTLASSLSGLLGTHFPDQKDYIYNAAFDTYTSHGVFNARRKTHYMPVGTAFVIGSTSAKAGVRRFIFAPSNSLKSQDRALGAAFAVAQTHEWKRVCVMLDTLDAQTTQFNIDWPIHKEFKDENEFIIVCK